MKRVFEVFGVLLAGWLLCAVSVRADVIWEPEDSFFREHTSECTYVNRLFSANGPDGIVILYKSPELPEEVCTWENGFQAFISHVYKDSRGIEWGIYDDYHGMIGWMPMEYMELVYDSISFREEHRAEIAKEKGALDGVSQGEGIYFWKYPGSENCYTVTVEDHAPEYSSVYVDGDGNRWGNVGYYYGRKDAWVCIDQPMADYAQLYPGETPRGEEMADASDDLQSEQPNATDRKSERIVPKPDNRIVAVTVLMVVLVMTATAGLLVLLKKAGKK